jgi:hypothetical protein
MLNRRQFLSATPAALAALAYAPSLVSGAADPNDAPALVQPPKIGFSSRTADLSSIKPGQVTAASPRVCKILQFTDLHFFNKTAIEDEMTIADFRKHVDRHRPDLVVVSGDLWHDNPEGRGQRGLDLATKTFSSWDVSWTMCWGNHDFLNDYQQGHDQLERAPNSVYRGGVSHGDHRIEVRPAGADPKDGPVLDLYFLNSSDEGLTTWQVRAFREMARHVGSARSKPVPALAFFHIPILEYETRINPATIKGVKMEGVGRGKENGQAFPALAAPQTLRACFCGHNHTNDYAVKADSIDLIYGRSSGYAGYGGDTLRKGAKLIEVDLSNGNYYQTSVFADGTKQIA